MLFRSAAADRLDCRRAVVVFGAVGCKTDRQIRKKVAVEGLGVGRTGSPNKRFAAVVVGAPVPVVDTVVVVAYIAVVAAAVAVDIVVAGLEAWALDDARVHRHHFAPAMGPCVKGNFIRTCYAIPSNKASEL